MAQPAFSIAKSRPKVPTLALSVKEMTHDKPPNDMAVHEDRRAKSGGRKRAAAPGQMAETQHAEEAGQLVLGEGSEAFKESKGLGIPLSLRY
jgi:hypothetical protein